MRSCVDLPAFNAMKDYFESIPLVEPCIAAIIVKTEAKNQRKPSSQIEEKKKVYAEFDHFSVSKS
jgi:hypothetical protein